MSRRIVVIEADKVKYDRDMRDVILAHIEHLRGMYDLELSPKIMAGQDIAEALKVLVGEAAIVLPLLSADLLSNKLLSNAVERAVGEWEKTGAPMVLPIIIRACAWQDWSPLKGIIKPINQKPIKSRRDKDVALQEVALTLQFFLDILLLDEKARKQSLRISELENKLSKYEN